MPLIADTHVAPAEPGRKRWLAAFLVAVAALAVVAGAWSATQRGSYGQSRAGCVTATIPSTTGGALVHGCGARARAMCRHAFRHGDRLSLLIRPACRQAGLS